MEGYTEVVKIFKSSQVSLWLLSVLVLSQGRGKVKPEASTTDKSGDEVVVLASCF